MVCLTLSVRGRSAEWVSVREILTCESLSKLAQELSSKINQDFSEVHEKLQSIKRIENYPVYEIIIDHEVEDVAEIFTRLNMAGVKIRESDVIITLVAVKQEGWVRAHFNPFLNDLEESGFEIDAAILIRTWMAICGISRLRNIPRDFWENQSNFGPAWDKTKKSIGGVVRQLNDIGILSSEILPSHSALIPLFVLQSKFGRDFNFKKALRWFLLATGDGRYSGSAITVLDQDIRAINSSPSFDDAIKKLIEPLSISDSFTEEDFLKDSSDEYLRLILYLVIFRNEAKDWMHQDIRIGYDRSDNQLNEGFKPEWHHFFPKKILKKHNIDEARINLLANIVVLNEKANKAFASKTPEEYLVNVKPERLEEQLIPEDNKFWKIENYNNFLDRRASNLKEAANNFMKELSTG